MITDFLGRFLKLRATEKQRVIYALAHLCGFDETEVDRRIHLALERQSASMFDAVGLYLPDGEMKRICELYKEIWWRLENHLKEEGYY